MLIMDPIINKLQRAGGISIYFSELLMRLGGSNINFCLLNKMQSKKLRYFDVSINGKSIFHSSYYRVAKKNVLNVTTVHDFTYEKFYTGYRRWIHSWQKFRAIRHSAAVICISENTKQDLMHYLPDVDPNRIFVVPNGVSDEFYPLPNIQTNSGNYVLFVGARVHYKNFDLAVKVLAQLGNIDLVAVGGGSFSAKELVLLNQYLPGRFRHAGFATTEQLNVLYNEALCLLYPSSYEGFGIPVIEAMRAGCPVVALNASSIPEVAGGAAILVDQPEVSGFVLAIDSLRCEEIISELRELGFAQAAKFSWDETFRQTVAVYEHVLGHPLPKRIDE